MKIEDSKLELGDETYKIFLNITGTEGKISDGLKKTLRHFRTSVLDEETSTPLTRRIDELVREAKSDPKWRCSYFTDPQVSLLDCVVKHSPQTNLRLQQ